MKQPFSPHSVLLLSPRSCAQLAAIVVSGFFCAAFVEGSACPPCGNVSVPYPLSTSSTCGDPLYKVVCDSASKLTLNAESGTYPIISINSQSQRLVVGSPRFSSNSCQTTDLSAGGFVLNPNLPFNITSSNTVMLFNCPSQMLFSPLNCSSNSLCTQFTKEDSEGAPCRGKLCCTLTAGGSATPNKIVVHTTDCSAYVSVLSLNPSSPVNQWRYGIELEWTYPSEPICASQRTCSQNSTCKKDPLSNTLKCLCDVGFHWNGSTGLCSQDIKVCPDGQIDNGLGCKRNESPIIAGITLGVAGFCVVVFVASVVYRKKRRAAEAKDKLTKERQEILSAGVGGRSAKLYASEDMKKATQNFAKERLLGSGGFGDVYKGVLEDGTVVAVKSAKVGNMKGIEQVLNEVRILSQVNHRNLVMLLGCCVEAEQPLLVYEFISNGTLLDHLEGSRGGFLEWRSRLRIAVHTAQGLAYLHSAAKPPIFHRDIKSSNILLDDSMNARVSDFGLSRLAHADLSHISTCAQGTLGYLDPEYYRNYQLTDKSDVYSFGIVLLELVTSQRAIEFARGQDYVNLAVYVSSKAEEGRLMEAIDGRLITKTNTSSSSYVSSSTSPALSPTMQGSSEAAAIVESIKQVALLALRCVQDSRIDRPSMREVLEELQYSRNMLEGASSSSGFPPRSSPTAMAASAVPPTITQFDAAHEDSSGSGSSFTLLSSASAQLR